MEVKETEVPDELRDVFMFMNHQAEEVMAPTGTAPGTKRRRAQGDQGNREGEDLRRLCQMMSRLLLRHEDSLNVLCQDHSWLIYMDRHQRGVTPMIMEATKNWHALHKKGETQ